MEFGSLFRRRNFFSSSNRRTLSTSNLSSPNPNDSTGTTRTTGTSSISTIMSCKSILISLPSDWDIGCHIENDGRVSFLAPSSPAHSCGVIQVGDFVRVLDVQQNTSTFTLQVTFGILIVEERPNCPLVIEIGNKSKTSLGLALCDSVTGSEIRVSSIQPGSLADRCGYIRAGDVLTSIQNPPVRCSPQYTSSQVAQILRKSASKNSSVTLTIEPCETLYGSSLTLTDADDIDRHAHALHLSISKRQREKAAAPAKFYFQSFGKNSGQQLVNYFQSPKKSSSSFNQNQDSSRNCVLSLCLWKDRLYEDWGFSVVDREVCENDSLLPILGQNLKGSIVHQIRRGGPAEQTGLITGDKILQINDQDVSDLESTMLVPVLASLDEVLNIVVLRTLTD